jgi:hypothetical protein
MELKEKINQALGGDRKVLIEVDYNDLDEAINIFLKSKGVDKEFEFVCDHELSNDVSKTFNVSNKTGSFTEKQESDIISGRFGWRGGDILDWMCREGLIEPGEYLVDVSW